MALVINAQQVAQHDALQEQGAIRCETQMRAAAEQVLRKGDAVRLVSSFPRMAVYSQDGGGFAIISTDADRRAVLAYSPDGTFDHTGNNPGFNWWLNAIGKATLRQTTLPDSTRFAPAVAPLITTKWGQNAPFRYMCPFLAYEPDLGKYGVYLPDSTHNAVGCGPAAMAQYMNYYKFPRHGNGSASVLVKYDQANVTLNVDFEHATYDWENMLDDYSGAYTDDNGRAVALLCYHAAVAAQANWTRLGGSTFDENIVKAFVEHFNYSDSARVIPRPLYDEPAWMEMIYGMLSAGHPVLYSGKDINFEVGLLVGHNFIIDGYDRDGLVHVNWGWHGQQDGYFDIATLTTGKLSFDDWQGMYINLYPNRETITGDIDGDGRVDVADVNAVINIILKAKTGSDYPGQADVDGDGRVDVADVNAIINIILNIVTTSSEGN